MCGIHSGWFFDSPNLFSHISRLADHLPARMAALSGHWAVIPISGIYPAPQPRQKLLPKPTLRLGDLYGDINSIAHRFGFYTFLYLFELYFCKTTFNNGFTSKSRLGFSNRLYHKPTYVKGKIRYGHDCSPGDGS
jgi:hypothetical protein